MIEKAVWTWQDGTYYISYHNRKPKNDNILMDFLHIDGKYNKAFQNYSSALQLFILLMICISALKTLIKPKVDEMLLIKGVVFAAFLFFLLWETRSRYLFDMTPLFILLMVDGMDTAKLFLIHSESLNNKQKNRHNLIKFSSDSRNCHLFFVIKLMLQHYKLFH